MAQTHRERKLRFADELLEQPMPQSRSRIVRLTKAVTVATLQPQNPDMFLYG